MTPRKRPHIVIFNPDQWRGDVVGHLGNRAAHTPHLDAMAQREAVSFRHAFCQNPVCTPSRCSFMSGWYPHVRGHRTMFHMLRPAEGDPNLLAILKSQGYFVWWGGKNDLVPAQGGFEHACHVKYQPHEPVETPWMIDRQAQWRGTPDSDTYYSFYVGALQSSPGYDHYHDHDWAMLHGAINLIQRHDADQPLCIYLPLLYPHPPYAVEEQYLNMIDRSLLQTRVVAPAGWSGKPQLLRELARQQRLETWSESRWDELRATYYGMCARVDHQFGLLCQALREAGIYDDTAIFFFSDHGDFTGDYGLVEKTQNTFEDCLSRVPLLVKPPAWHGCHAGVSEALVELVDFPATVFDLTGINPGYTHFGRSLLPLIAGHTAEHREAVFCQGGRMEHEEHCAERESGVKPGGLYWPRVSLQERVPEHGKAIMCRSQRYKYVRRIYESDELYDLGVDPGETSNVINEPAYREVVAQHKDHLLKFLLSTSDAVPWDADER